METTRYILTLLLSTVSVSSIIIYLGKKFIDKSLELGVESFKNSLNTNLETHKAELSRETEEFKAGLNIIELEHRIKYSKLHEDRANVIKKLYSLLIEVQAKLSYFTSLFQGPEWKTDITREDAAKQTLGLFKNFFLENRIYFTIELCNQIDEISKLSWQIIVDMSVAKVTDVYGSEGGHKAIALREWENQNNKVNTELDGARLNLEKEFRKLIGVN